MPSVAIVRITARNNVPFVEALQFNEGNVDGQTVYLDLTGAVLKMSLRKHRNHSKSSLDMTSENGMIEIDEPTLGRITLKIPQSVIETIPLGYYAYDLVAEWSPENKRILMEGRFEIENGITKL